MATVDGFLTDFTDVALPAGCRIRFVPSGPAINGSFIHATKPIYVYPEPAGHFTAFLTPTDGLRPFTYYTMTIEWLDPLNGYIGVDFLEWHLTVPAEGGAIGPLIGTAATPNSMQVYWSAAAPDPWPIGLAWVNTITGDVKRRTA